MSKKGIETPVNLYYLNNNGQSEKETIEDMMKRKKAKEKERRLREKELEKERKQLEKRSKLEKNTIRNDEEFSFDKEMDTVINMTNRNNTRHEEEKIKKQNVKERKRKRKIRRIRRILIAFLIVGGIIGGSIFTLTSPTFNIKDIKVNNNKMVTAENIIKISGLEKDKNIFKFYSGLVKSKIKDNPYIEEVEIKRKLPNTVEINVSERKEAFIFETKGQFAYINTQGYILNITKEKKNLPLVKGFKTKEENIIVGNRLETEDLEKLEEVIKINSHANDNGLEGKISIIEVEKKNDYKLYIESENKVIYLGEANNLINKMLYIQKIMEEEKGKAGDIFVNGDNNTKFQPYFREKV